MKTKKAKPAADTTLQTRVMPPPAVDPPSADEAEQAAGWNMNIHRLIENYHNLIRTREIYYPLAYRFTRELGRGRQGVVFQALRQGARGCLTRHAIKVHDPAIYPSTEKYWTDMGRIASQVSRLQMVSSPQLVSRDIYEEVNGIGYTQMEMVQGMDVHQLVHGNHFDRARLRSTPEEWAHFNDVIFHDEKGYKRIQPGVAVYIMRQTLRGLEALHDAGFLHSDIKPSNMMIDRLGLVKLIDYGRAVLVDEKHTFLMGTPLFMAPELHGPGDNSVQADIYSVGLVGLELLRGEPLVEMPPDGLPEAELLRIKKSLPDRLPELLPSPVRENRVLIDMLRRFLHPDPTKRYPSASDAEAGPDGLVKIHKQLALVGKDSEYDRELGNYVEKLPSVRDPLPQEMDEVIA
jgi:eukaryotic-like serine/threonine-protein kinase